MSQLQSLSTNILLAQNIVEEVIRNGVVDFCVAPGSRNSPLVYALAANDQVKVYYWSEERSAAFFALGRIQSTKKPVAIVTTSGTAAAECLPAVMNAHYLSLPLLVITADRPKRFRGSGAPQTAEQKGLFGCYAHFELDLALDDNCDLEAWSCVGPAHLNICFEEPSEAECLTIQVKKEIPVIRENKALDLSKEDLGRFYSFIENVRFPLVIVGGLPVSYREEVTNFLLKLKAPIYAEAFSNIREEPWLEPLLITRIDKILKNAENNDYAVDGILRLGEIPTARLWRDLEEMGGGIQVCSISEQPFSGLSWNTVIHTSLPNFCKQADLDQKHYSFARWKESDRIYQKSLTHLMLEEPLAEPSLIANFSKKIPFKSNVYLGNSLPIREWDMTATHQDKQLIMQATRGLNGIDGQISTFLGSCFLNRDNWALLGDLTALYDMAGPWILHQMQDTTINIVIVNNRGGQIFSRMYALPVFTNLHSFDFEHLAAFWRMKYELWEDIPQTLGSNSLHRLIEIAPDAQSTQRFWKKESFL